MFDKDIESTIREIGSRRALNAHIGLSTNVHGINNIPLFSIDAIPKTRFDFIKKVWHTISEKVTG